MGSADKTASFKGQASEAQSRMTVLVDRNKAYDPLVYENTPENWGKIFGMFFLFYCVNGMHWWANFALGIHATDNASYYNIFIFFASCVVIGIMLANGSVVNTKKLTHEYYTEKISETRILKAEAEKKELKRQQEKNRAKVYLEIPEDASPRQRKTITFKNNGAATFAELLKDFKGLKEPVTPAKLDDLWKMLDSNGDGVHQKMESRAFMEQVVTFLGKEMPKLFENWDNTFARYSDGTEFIDKRETAKLIEDIHSG